MAKIILTEKQVQRLKINLQEEINPNEAYRNPSSFQTVVDGKRCIAFIAAPSSELEQYIAKAEVIGLKIILVRQPNSNAIIIYRNGCEENASRLNKIARKNNGFLPINKPEEVYVIGILLGYQPQKVKEFVLSKFPDFIFY